MKPTAPTESLTRDHGSESTPLESVQSPVQEVVPPEAAPNTPQRNRTKQNLWVLDHGFVRLDDYMGDDLSVVNSARVSYGKRKETMDESDEKLVSYLLRNRHGTPFEHSTFKFHVKLPLFVAREWIRHRIGSFNEQSLRYTVIEPEFYIPEPEDVRIRVGAPSKYSYEPAYIDDAKLYCRTLTETSLDAALNYRSFVGDGIAPELARLFLPVNVYTEWYWTVNARSLMNFLSLRNAPTAQLEIQRYAVAVEHAWAAIMPVTHKAFVANERQAP